MNKGELNMPTLKDLQLYKEKNKYYFSALLDFEDKKGFYEISIPRIRLPISLDCAIDYTSSIYGENLVEVDLGFGKLYAEPFGDKNSLFTVTCLEEKVHEMTLAEIEKELGYRIKIKKEHHK
jgi:hypothetical protein